MRAALGNSKQQNAPRTRLCRGLLPALALFAAPALADDPNANLSAEELAADRAEIRRLNLEQLRHVRERDAGYARGWRAHRAAREEEDYYTGALRAHERERIDYAQSRRAYEADTRAYARDRADYEAAMDQWREDSAACRAGDYARCR